MTPHAPGPLYQDSATRVRRSVGANQRIHIDDPARVWAVSHGSVEVFAVRLLDGEPVGPRRWLFTASAGSALFAVPVINRDTLAIIAIAATESEIEEFDVARLREAARQSDETTAWAAGLLDSWIEAISSAIARLEDAKVSQTIEPGATRAFAAERRVGVRGPVVWVRCVRGLTWFLGLGALSSIRESSGAFPLAAGTWILTRDDVELEAYSTSAWMQQTTDWSDFDTFRAFEAFRQFELPAGFSELVEVSTPSGGRHLWYRCETPVGGRRSASGACGVRPPTGK